MNMKHTPGPWEITAANVLGRMATVIDGICIVLGHGRIPNANARLIAAAPDLLAALEAAEAAIMDEVNASDGEDHPVIRAHAKVAAEARAAIAKATGAA